MFFICLWGVNFWQRTDEIMVCFSSLCGAWISDKEQMNFIVCFLSVYGSVNFWQRMDGFYGMFFIHLWGMNFWQRTDEFYCMFFICLWECEFLTQNGYRQRWWDGTRSRSWWTLQGCGTKQNICLSPQMLRSGSGVGRGRQEWSGLVRLVKDGSEAW